MFSKTYDLRSQNKVLEGRLSGYVQPGQSKLVVVVVVVVTVIVAAIVLEMVVVVVVVLLAVVQGESMVSSDHVCH